ncbi:hypothetical protein BASA60_010794 [Batrachochytrium salamandrivorans]|nr:hypothetical protein BASA60_010794 [Batrachochytrium salamandrivorans]
MSIFMNSYALQLQQSHQLALVAQIYACSPYAQLDQYFGYWRQPPATYPVVGYPSQWSLQNNGVFSATPQSDFFGNTQAYPYLSDSEKRRIALVPISGNEESADDNGSQAACEQEEEAAIPAIEEDKGAQDSQRARNEAEKRPRKMIKPLVHTTAPKRSQSNRTQKPLAPKHKLAIKIAPSTSYLTFYCVALNKLQSHTHGKLLCQPTPKKERFHVKPKKPQTHSVTQASGRQNISGDVRNHPDLISTAKKNRYNTNRDGQPKIGSIKWR